ncbi:MAG: FAD:protein FMN transferase, partial [Candidatus Binatia bacterium]
MLSLRARVAAAALVAAVVATAVLRLSTPSTTGDWVGSTRDIMATPISVLLRGSDAAAASLVFDVFREVDARMSEWKASSPLSSVNRAAGTRAVAVPADLRALLRRGVTIGDRTGGAFDISWAALWGVWDFRSPSPRLPEQAEVARRAALVDYRRVVIDDAAGTVGLPVQGMMLGLGGIAKGYALERAAAALRAGGVQDFLISAGGQMMAGGLRDGRPWRIGIRDPRGALEDYFAYVEATNVSTATSGDYESYFVIDGRRYHHILDPRTGWPAAPRDPLLSATVLSADATLADALSTALVVMGTSRALELVETTPDVEAVLVDAAALVHVSSGLAGRVELLH